MEKAEIQRKYEKEEYYKYLNVVDLEIDFLEQFIGNRRRLDDETYESLKKDIAEKGLKHPLYLIIGKQNKMVKLGEGNHRLNILKELGCDVVPVLIEVKNSIYYSGGYEPRYYEYINDNVQKQNPKLSEVFTEIKKVYNDEVKF